MNRIAAVLLVLPVAVSMMATACQYEPVSWTGENWKPAVGVQAEDFELAGLDGQSVRLSDFQGRPVLLNFWASWCSPCNLEMPFIQAVNDEWPSGQLAVLTVNIRESAGQVQDFMDKKEYSFNVLLDTDGAVASQYRVGAIPATFLIDREGIIRKIKIGAYPSRAVLEADLAEITGGT